MKVRKESYISKCSFVLTLSMLKKKALWMFVGGVASEIQYNLSV